ncbi:MAG: mechanosensitive ion channel family protein [Nitrosopumilus sp.]|nr:mechanosensitive ion channel family protein [Nitrosopumilus sp.]
MDKILQQEWLGNTIESYLWFIGIILFGFLFLRFITRVLSKLLFKIFKQHSEGVSLENFLTLLRTPVAVFLFLITFLIAAQHLEYPPQWNLEPVENFGLKSFMKSLFQVLLVLSITWIISRLVDFVGLILAYRASLTDSKSDDQLVPFFRDALKIIIIIFGFFFILGAVFNLNIASLIAGLGIGGLAVALAAKESLENLFGSFTIFLDKPFVVGDMVQVGSIIGTVERIGFRSTRLRTLEKSYVTIPNKKMVDSELDNLSLRTFRRARFNFGVTYDTSVEQIKAIVSDIQKFINDHPNTNQDGNVRFLEFGDSSLDIMVQYFVDTMDWNIFIKIKEEINFEIMEIVKKHGSSFAFPSRSVYLEKTN